VAEGAQAHIPVLAGPALDWLAVQPAGVYVDCTAGAGGHAAQIAARLETGRLIALDRDPKAVAMARERLAPFAGATVVHANYGQLREVLDGLRIGSVEGILLDAGVSSMQLDAADRGFSFQQEGPLDMRMDTSTGLPAAAWLQTVSEPELAQVLRQYGDVKPARRIASAIVRRRAAGQLESTGDLASAVKDALQFVRGMPEEVRTVFQAIRIGVNEELQWLEAGLEQAIDCLAPGGRLVVIAFHSGEDRVSKQVLQRASRPERVLHPDGRVRAVHAPRLRLLTRKPVTPDAEEVRVNPRAASARLRAAERLREGATA